MERVRSEKEMADISQKRSVLKRRRKTVEYGRYGYLFIAPFLLYMQYFSFGHWCIQYG